MKKIYPFFLKNAFIVIPAANDAKLNEKIAGIAKEREIFVNRVDDIGDIIIPSVSGEGYCNRYFHWRSKSCPFKIYPAKTEEVITPEYAQMSRLQNEIREKLKSLVNDQKKRKEILWNIINDNDVWKAFEESYEKAYMKASRHIM